MSNVVTAARGLLIDTSKSLQLILEVFF